MCLFNWTTYYRVCGGRRPYITIHCNFRSSWLNFSHFGCIFIFGAYLLLHNIIFTVSETFNEMYMLFKTMTTITIITIKNPIKWSNPFKQGHSTTLSAIDRRPLGEIHRIRHLSSESTCQKWMILGETIVLRLNRDGETRGSVVVSRAFILNVERRCTLLYL